MPQKCTGCGAEIPADSNLGACPKCLLAVGLDAGAQVAGGPEPEVGDRIGPYKLLEKIGGGGCGTPEVPFYKQWALTIIDGAIGRLRTRYVEDGKGDVFEDLKDFIVAKKATPHADLAIKHGITASAIGVAIHRLRQRYAELLREEIAATVNDPSEIDDEIRDLIAALGD